MRNLSDLPLDMFLLIAEKTTIRDAMVMKAVCTAWRSLLQNHLRLPSQLPWLILPNKEEPYSRFYDPADDRFYRIAIPESYENRICGSSSAHGYLVAVDLNPRVLVFNPITRHQFELPPITTFPHVLQFRGQYFRREYRCVVPYNRQLNTRESTEEFVRAITIKATYMRKVLLTGNPFSSSSSYSDDDFVAVAICGYFGRLGFCRRGDDEWKLVNDELKLKHFVDVVYCNEKKLFYATGQTGQLVTCDLRGPVPVTKTIIRHEDLKFFGHKSYLAISSGELLLVVRAAKYEREYYRTTSFKIYKLDEGSRMWVKMTSIGDRVLFVGINATMCLPAASKFSRFKGNHVYFTDNLVDYHKEGMIGGHDVGAINLETNELISFSCCEKLGDFISPHPLWFMMPTQSLRDFHPLPIPLNLNLKAPGRFSRFFETSPI